MNLVNKKCILMFFFSDSGLLYRKDWVVFLIMLCYICCLLPQKEFSLNFRLTLLPTSTSIHKKGNTYLHKQCSIVFLEIEFISCRKHLSYCFHLVPVCRWIVTVIADTGCLSIASSYFVLCYHGFIFNDMEGCTLTA